MTPDPGRSIDSPSAPELKERLEAERRGVPFLVYRDEGEQRIVDLDPERERLTVGRGSDVDLRLDDREVSRVHAELQRTGGEWTVLDDDLSHNGTFVNGQRITGRRRLRDLDRLRVGQTALIFREPGGTPPDDATATAAGRPRVDRLTDTQRRVLIALCRPYKDGSPYATPATNQQVAAEVHLGVDAVKAHLRALFAKFEVPDLPHNQKRARLAERAFESGLITLRDL
jgi:pSer/pThr/pTyr-binding forkhead associated (FHA) protein